MGESFEEKQERLNYELGHLFNNLEYKEIEFVKHYINFFEKQGFDLKYFKRKIKFIENEKNLFNETKKELLKENLYFN